MSAGVAVRVDGRTYRGRGIDLRGCGLDPAAVLAAVRRGTGVGAEPGDDLSAVAVAASCPPPAPAHARLGLVSDAPIGSERRLLAAVARSRGRVAPQRAELDAVEAALADRSAPGGPDLAAARERAAEAGDAEAALRERVAALRGRLHVRREIGDDEGVASVRSALADAVGELSEAETERIAARQALDRAEERADRVRDARERHLRSIDRRDNLRREARAHLADAVRDRYGAAVRDLSGGARPAGGAGAAETDPVLARLAAVRSADLAAPVVLAAGGDRFDGAAAAAERLGAPVVVL